MGTRTCVYTHMYSFSQLTMIERSSHSSSSAFSAEPTSSSIEVVRRQVPDFECEKMTTDKVR